MLVSDGTSISPRVTLAVRRQMLRVAPNDLQTTMIQGLAEPSVRAEWWIELRVYRGEATPVFH